MSSTLTPYNGLQVLTPNPTGDAGLAINDNFMELSERIASPSTLILPATGTATENGSALLAAYTQAKTLTPYGNAISATNRVTLLLSPGVYDVGASALTLDTSYIDLAGTGANPDDTRITRTVTTGAVSTGTVVHTADYVNVTNLTINMGISGTPTFTHDDTEPAALFITSALANVIYDRVNFSATTNYRAMRVSINYAGEFRFCTCATDCGFGGGYTGTSTASGKFISCKSGNMSFGGADTAATGNATGTFLLCHAGVLSFGKTSASGKFYFCAGSALCFNGCTGLFVGCTSSISCFTNRTNGRFVECVDSGNFFSSAPLVTDGSNMSVGTSTGTKLATATTQKLGFYGATPITQPANTTDLRQTLINLGLLATGGATPLNLNGGSLTAGASTFNGRVNTPQAINIGTSTYTANPQGEAIRIDHIPSGSMSRLISAGIFAQLNPGVTASQYVIGVDGRSVLLHTSSDANLPEAYGLRFNVENRSSGTVGSAYGMMGKVYNYSAGTGVINYAYGGSFEAASGTSAVYNNAYGINTSNVAGVYGVGLNVGTVSGTYAFGIRIANNISGSSTANAIRSYSTAASRFDGSIGILNDPTALMDLGASTTSQASLRLRSGTDPTSPNDGDIWYDGANLKICVAGNIKTLSFTS